MQEQLAGLRRRGQKKEVGSSLLRLTVHFSPPSPPPPSPLPPSQCVELAQTIPQFGYRQMNGLLFNHPSEQLQGFARIGRCEIVTYTTSEQEGEGVRCHSYQLTRIRCWKVGYQVCKKTAIIIQLSTAILTFDPRRTVDRNGWHSTITMEMERMTLYGSVWLAKQLYF